jgi:RNA polymerase sigma-70 factor (ECF subfamily)
MQRKDSRHPRFLQVIEERTGGSDAGPRPRDGGLQMDLESVIRSLPEGARNVFVLCAVHGYSHEETATMLGVAVGTCKAQLHRARRLLADRLDA